MDGQLPHAHVDEVFLEGLRFFAYHGVHPEEKARGQRFTVDVRMWADLRPAGESDDLTLTINYSAVHRAVRAIVEGPPRDLIEAVAEDIAVAVLAGFPPVARVEVTVRKPEVGLKGAFLDAAGVRIARSRPEATP